MYDDTRYSLARYSLGREAKTLPIELRFAETMGAVAGGAVPVDMRERFSEVVQGSARGTISVAIPFAVQEQMGAVVRMSADVVVRVALSGILQSRARGSKDTPVVLSALEGLGSIVWAAKGVTARRTVSDGLMGSMWAAKDLPAVLSASEALTALLSATSQTTERAVFQLTIPPGGELRIDSGLFTVLLDGENVLYAQSGDWVEVSRDLLRLTVESASGRLEGQLIYTERYL